MDKQVNKKISLQMVVKAINNLARLDKIISIFLIFGTYPQITKMDTLSLSVTKEAKVIRTAIKEIHCL